MKLLVNAIIHICTCLQLFISRRNNELLSLHLLLFYRRHMMGEALMVSTAIMHDVSLGLYTYISTSVCSDGTWCDTV